VLIAHGGMYAPWVAQGAVWRLFTAPWLHRSWLHLLGNLVGAAGLVSMGARRGWLPAFGLGGAAGALASYLLGVVLSVGASGGLFAVGASTVVATLRSDATGEARRRSGPVLGAGLVAAGALSWLMPGADVAAHLGGAVVGVAIGVLRGQSLESVQST
jgi:rhomboid protease GluP